MYIYIIPSPPVPCRRQPAPNGPPSGSCIFAAESEADIFAKLGLRYVHPTKRKGKNDVVRIDGSPVFGVQNRSRLAGPPRPLALQ